MADTLDSRYDFRGRVEPGDKVSSWDIYDTCVARTVPGYAVRNELARRLPQWPDLFDARNEAARLAYEREEYPRLDEIYAILSELAPEIDAEAVMAEELKIEREVTFPIRAAQERIARDRAAGWRIAFVSDMYLPYDFMRGYMEEFGFLEEGDIFIVSSDIRLSKRKGTLFPHLKEELFSLRTVHHGDDPMTDVEAAQKACVDYEQILWAEWSPYEEQWKRLGQDELAQTIREQRLRKGSEHPMWQVGYNMAGAIGRQFTRWIGSEIEPGTPVLFATREGYLLQQLAPEGMEAHYLPLSRNSIFNCKCLPDDPKFRQWLCSGPEQNVRGMLSLLGWEPQPWRAKLEACGLDDFEKWLYDGDLDALFDRFFADPEVVEALRETQGENLRQFQQFWEKRGLPTSGKVALADIGWKGTSQRKLEQVLQTLGWEVEMTGYYVNSNSKDVRTRSWFDLSSSFILRYKVILENLFAGSHGEVRCYRDGEPVFHRALSVHPEDFAPYEAGALAFPEVEIPHASIEAYIRAMVRWPTPELARAYRSFRFNSSSVAGHSLIPYEPPLRLRRPMPWIEGYLALNTPKLLFLSDVYFHGTHIWQRAAPRLRKLKAKFLS